MKPDELRRALGRPSHCRSCGAPIVWATTRGGKRIPVDYGPADDGTIELERGRDGVLRARVVAAQLSIGEAGGSRHRAHFATCPHADSRWRGRR